MLAGLRSPALMRPSRGVYTRVIGSVSRFRRAYTEPTGTAYYPGGTRGDGLQLQSGGEEILMLRAVTSFPGVVVQAVAGRNGTGSGRLRSSGDGALLAWQAPGSETFGNPARVTDGVYVLEDGEDPSRWIRVRVYADYLPTGPSEARVFLDDRFNEIGGDNVDAAEALAGAVETFTVQLANVSGNNALNVKLWLDPHSAGLANIQISADNVSFVSPNSEQHADVLSWATIANGASEDVYIRRTVAAGAERAAKILNFLQYAWDGF